MTGRSGPEVPAQLIADEFELLVKLLALHYVNPLPYPLAGGSFEEVFAAAISGRREGRKLLFDVLRDTIGWSLKTAQQEKSRSDSFEIVLQRCDILKDRTVSLGDPVEDLGRKIIDHFNAFYTKSVRIQDITDQRAAFLIRNRSEHNFIFFQQHFALFEPGEVTWAWANAEKRSLVGRAEGRLIYRWYRSGTQLFGVYQIPANAHAFEIQWKRADMDATLAHFTAQGLTSIRVLP